MNNEIKVVFILHFEDPKEEVYYQSHILLNESYATGELTKINEKTPLHKPLD